MAFLDNSGDIILDAVLTDVGRKRMAKGNFRITKFAIGDDEIDYALYNKDHASGSAYYDLEILQTPVLEAFTQMNANINYGLVSYARQDLLYLPVAKMNEKTFSSRIVQKTGANGVVYVADDTKTNANGAVTSKVMITSGAAEKNILKSGVRAGRLILIETGINQSNLKPSSANQSSYLTSVGLADNSFMVRYDKRFIGGVLGPTVQASLTNSSQQGATLTVDLGGSRNTRSSKDLLQYNETIVHAAQNRIYADFANESGDTSTQYSAISGPRASFTCLNFIIQPNITQSDYSKYGKTANDLFSDGTLFDFIDTTIYAQGLASNVSIQVPIRIIKLAQT